MARYNLSLEKKNSFLLQTTLNFFIEIGFKVRTIVPADHPRMAVMQGFGLTIRLDCASVAPAAHLRLLTTGEVSPTVTAPNGTVIEFVPANPPLNVPDLQEAFVVTRMPTGDTADEAP